MRAFFQAPGDLTALGPPAEYVFWLCLFLVAYTYLLYPCLLFVAYSLLQMRRDWRALFGPRDRRRAPLADEALPGVSFVVPAYNEQDHLGEKIANLRRIDYPPDRFEVLFVSDGSTDATNEILAGVEDPGFQTVILPGHGGKASALNRGVANARYPILVFSDASTLFAPDSLKKMVRHFSDPLMGVVCGALRFQGSSESRQTEGVYWRYETALRMMEARLGATLTASGAIYALRRECYVPLAPDVVIDDFVVPMNTRKLGYRVTFDPEAMATEFSPDSVRDEFARRVRLAVGSFRALGELMRVPLAPFTRWAFLSHKFLRWVLPFVMVGLLLSNAFLLREPFYQAMFLAQLLFYAWAAVGYVFRERLQGVRYALMGYFLLAMNAAFLVGFLRFVAGRREVKWKSS